MPSKQYIVVTIATTTTQLTGIIFIPFVMAKVTVSMTTKRSTHHVLECRIQFVKYTNHHLKEQVIDQLHFLRHLSCPYR